MNEESTGILWLASRSGTARFCFLCCGDIDWEADAGDDGEGTETWIVEVGLFELVRAFLRDFVVGLAASSLVPGSVSDSELEEGVPGSRR